MTTFQIIMICIWGIFYTIITIFAIKDLVEGNFIVKNDSSNIFTALWVIITVAGLLALTLISFNYYS